MDDSSLTIYIEEKSAEIEKMLTPIVEAIVDAVPELKDSYAEHVRQYEGKALPYVYVADAVRILNEQLWAQQLSMDAIKRLCSTIENALGKENPDIDALIFLAFLEPLEGTMLFPIARSEFGPRTRKALLEMWGWSS